MSYQWRPVPLLALLTLSFAALLAGLVVGALLNRRAFERRRDAQITELFAGIETLPVYFRVEDILELPEPAQRFLNRNLNEGMPAQSCVRMLESGNLRERYGQPWTEFEGESYFTSAPVASLCFVRLRPYPLVWVDELSLLSGGRARLSAKLLSSLSTRELHDADTLRAALTYYLAHLPLLPGAMLPGDDRGWRDAGEDSACFWVRVGELEVSGVFHFDELGNALRFTTDARPYAGSSKAESKVWTASYGEHRDFGDGGDLQLPTKVELAWELDGERFAYLDKRIDAWRLDEPHPWSKDRELH